MCPSPHWLHAVWLFGNSLYYLRKKKKKAPAHHHWWGFRFHLRKSPGRSCQLKITSDQFFLAVIQPHHLNRSGINHPLYLFFFWRKEISIYRESHCCRGSWTWALVATSSQRCHPLFAQTVTHLRRCCKLSHLLCVLFNLCIFFFVLFFCWHAQKKPPKF